MYVSSATHHWVYTFILFHFFSLRPTRIFCSLYTVCFFNHKAQLRSTTFPKRCVYFFVFLEHEMMKMVQMLSIPKCDVPEWKPCRITLISTVSFLLITVLCISLSHCEYNQVYTYSVYFTFLIITSYELSQIVLHTSKTRCLRFHPPPLPRRNSSCWVSAASLSRLHDGTQAHHTL